MPEIRLTPPEGNVSVEEAIAEEICAMAHQRNSTYVGGHCNDCMVIAEYAVKIVLAGLPANSDEPTATHANFED